MSDNAEDASVFILREHTKSCFFLAYFLCLFCDFTYGLAFSYKATVICVTALFAQWM